MENPNERAALERAAKLGQGRTEGAVFTYMVALSELCQSYKQGGRILPQAMEGYRRAVAYVRWMGCEEQVKEIMQLFSIAAHEAFSGQAGAPDVPGDVVDISRFMPNPKNQI